MPEKTKAKPDLGPVIKISLLNYDLVKKDHYSQQFITLLIKGLLKNASKTDID